ncbi:MAG TPA: glycine--tRNA ligase subunit beta, partial [Thermoanaerobaculia bacterium]|nr:glycine--tRNA ligase subunit beta [Thermoanaerobaculia bacterium]
EEIPARMLPGASRELATRLFEELMARGLGPREVETGYTPRRLVLVLAGLPEREPDREEQVMGPPARAAWGADGAPTQALLGFARRCGVAPEELARVRTEKGEYLAATRKIAGRATAEVLAELVPRVLGALSWPKTMRWGSGEGPWVRPVHGIVSLLDGSAVPFAFFGVAAGETTEGHPVLSPEEFQVRNASHYRDELTARRIEVRPAARREGLLAGMRERAEAVGGTLVDDPALLDKLVALCEVPGMLEGQFDSSYLELPREVLTTSLRDHQSALTVAGADGALLPYFLTVMDRPDDPAGRVRAGNEWVVAARLADARFFYGEDRKRPLAARAGQLAHLTFHEALGSYAAKADRLAELAGWIARALGWEEEATAAEEAARLLKLDLTTDMVKEFTSLQGVMGGIYLREQGAAEAVWQAVYDQYLPASAEDRIPRGRAGRVAALADRLDTLVGFFGLGLVPSGSRDPFGLRRAAQGVVRILLDGDVALEIDAAVEEAARLYGASLPRPTVDIVGDLRSFLADRIRYLLGLAGYAYDEIEAALAAGWSELPDLRARVEAVHKAREEEGFLSVALAAKRIANILRGAGGELPLDEALLAEPAERDLHAAYAALAAEVEAGSARRDHEGVLRQVAHLAPVLDRFFVEVLVMAPDERLRTNRLALLQHLQRAISRTAKLTEVVVEKA